MVAYKVNLVACTLVMNHGHFFVRVRVCVCVHVLLVFFACLYLLLSWILSFWLLPMYVGFDCIFILLLIFYILGFSILVTCIWVTIKHFIFFFIFWFWCHVINILVKYLYNSICCRIFCLFFLFISGHKKEPRSYTFIWKLFKITID
jgi:hypothetical protein